MVCDKPKSPFVTIKMVRWYWCTRIVSYRTTCWIRKINRRDQAIQNKLTTLLTDKSEKTHLNINQRPIIPGDSMRKSASRRENRRLDSKISARAVCRLTTYPQGQKMRVFEASRLMDMWISGPGRFLD
mgnify:CR=1 FL=1